MQLCANRQPKHSKQQVIFAGLSVCLHIVLGVFVFNSVSNGTATDEKLHVMQVQLIQEIVPKVKAAPKIMTKPPVMQVVEEPVSVLKMPNEVVHKPISKMAVQYINPVKSAPVVYRPSLENISTAAISQPVSSVSRVVAQQAVSSSGNAKSLRKNVAYKKYNPPKYPKRARRLGQEGTVLLHILIDKNGHTKELKMQRTSGFSILDDAAIKAAKKWQFEPAVSLGRTIVSWAEVPVMFTLQ